MSRIIGLDFETFYSSKIGYGIRELGMNRYCCDDRFNPYLLSVSDGTDSWAGSLKRFNWDSISGATLASHNKAFDAMVYEAAVEKGMAPRIKPAAWHCTANMSAYLCNKRSLSDACEELMKISISKDVRDYANGKSEADMRADGRWEEMLNYARGDAFHCQQLFAKFSHRWPEHERRLSEMTIRQGTEGIQIDVGLLKTYIVKAATALRIAEEQLPWIQEGRAPSSPKAMAELCRKEGIPCPPVKSRDGEEAFIDWEKAYCTRFPWIAHVANWRSINKFLGSLETIQTRLTPDGVLSFSLKYFGAHTGRWSGDAGLNMQNLRKDPLYLDDRGWLISDLTRLKEIAFSPELPAYVDSELDIRKLFVARPGKKLIIPDLSQIEPRTLSWLVGDKDKLAMMAAGQSPYEAHARVSMGWTGGNLKTENKELYALAKARELALGYGCGWEKFILMAQVLAGIDITENDPEFEQVYNMDGNPCVGEDGMEIIKSGYGSNSRRIVREFRESSPKITGLWKRLDEEFKNSVGGDFEMTLPSGRTMRYPEVRREIRLVPKDDGEPGMKRKIVYTARIGARRFVCYGGLLTENLTQAVARDVFAEQLLALDSTPGVRVLFHVHDEAVCETSPEVTVRDLEQIMSKTPAWLEGCPIAAEGKETPHYLK